MNAQNQADGLTNALKIGRRRAKEGSPLLAIAIYREVIKRAAGGKHALRAQELLNELRKS